MAAETRLSTINYNLKYDFRKFSFFGTLDNYIHDEKNLKECIRGGVPDDTLMVALIHFNGAREIAKCPGDWFQQKQERLFLILMSGGEDEYETLRSAAAATWGYVGGVYALKKGFLSFVSDDTWKNLNRCVDSAREATSVRDCLNKYIGIINGDWVATDYSGPNHGAPRERATEPESVLPSPAPAAAAALSPIDPGQYGRAVEILLHAVSAASKADKADGDFSLKNKLINRAWWSQALFGSSTITDTDRDRVTGILRTYFRDYRYDVPWEPIQAFLDVLFGKDALMPAALSAYGALRDKIPKFPSFARWEQACARFTHDWLKNQFLLALSTWLKALKGEIYAPDAKAAVVVLLDTWPKCRDEVTILIGEAPDSFAGEDALNWEPLTSLDAESKELLRSFINSRWGSRKQETPAVSRAVKALAKADQCCRDLTESLNASKENPEAVLTRVEETITVLGDLAGALGNLARLGKE